MRSSLAKSADFTRVFEEGRSRANASLVLYWTPRADDGAENRLGLIVSRGVGNAVTQNRLKRVLREAFAVVSVDWPRAHDYILIARPPLVAVDKTGGLAAVSAQVRALTPRRVL
jgi:ribonuclease P protein component